MKKYLSLILCALALCGCANKKDEVNDRKIMNVADGNIVIDYTDLSKLDDSVYAFAERETGAEFTEKAYITAMSSKSDPIDILRFESSEKCNDVWATIHPQDEHSEYIYVSYGCGALSDASYRGALSINIKTNELKLLTDYEYDDERALNIFYVGYDYICYLGSLNGEYGSYFYNLNTHETFKFAGKSTPLFRIGDIVYSRSENETKNYYKSNIDGSNVIEISEEEFTEDMEKGYYLLPTDYGRTIYQSFDKIIYKGNSIEIGEQILFNGEVLLDIEKNGKYTYYGFGVNSNELIILSTPAKNWYKIDMMTGDVVTLEKGQYLYPKSYKQYDRSYKSILYMK